MNKTIRSQAWEVIYKVYFKVPGERPYHLLFHSIALHFLRRFTMVYTARTGALSYSLNSDNDPEGDIIAILPSKEYIPKDDELGKDVIPSHGADKATYLLSKLSDKELLSLLNDQPKKNKFALNDIVKASGSYKNKNDHKTGKTDKYMKKEINYKEITQGQNLNPEAAFFRLDDKEVQPYNFKTGVDPNYLALQKIQNLLYSRPAQQDLNGDEKKELLFDMLTAQLKKLCCKSSKSKKVDLPQKSYQSDLNGALNKKISPNHDASKMALHEHMFLIINDEITNDENDDLITVDPESLSVNSSVLLLGPITTPLTETQLKLVMTRISKELSKDEYLPLFHQISEGRLSEFNTHLVKSLISGPSTRRYIKPHRCNHQSKLARIYAGPKWLVCTGYLNINTPSLYD